MKLTFVVNVSTGDVARVVRSERVASSVSTNTRGSNTPSHLLYLRNLGVWIPATRGKDGWRFRNGHDAALWLQEP